MTLCYSDTLYCEKSEKTRTKHDGYLDSTTLLHNKAVVTCKIKHLQKCSKMFQCFILHVTTAYLQHVFNMFATFLQHLCDCFSVKHFKPCCNVVKYFILHVTTCKIFLQMFYFTCNHRLSSACVQHAKNLQKRFATLLLMFWCKTF